MKKNIIAILSHNPVIILIAAFILLLLFYYIASPYQNCINLNDSNSIECLKITSW